MQRFQEPALEQLQGRDIRLAFFDIDGTLLGPEGRCSARVREAVLAARRAGMRTAVASGRPRFAAQFLIDDLQLLDAGSFYTGALLYEPKTSSTLRLQPLEAHLAQRVLAAAQALHLYTELCTEDSYFVEQRTALGDVHAGHLRVEPEQRPLREVLHEFAVVKLLFAVDSARDQQKLRQLERAFPETTFAYANLVSHPDWLFASVISQQACKTTGFQQLLEHHGVCAEQVMAFGDAQSDMTFLSLAGLGVAMGNAAPEVRAIADLVTAPVWEDGVAVVLERVLESVATQVPHP